MKNHNFRGLKRKKNCQGENRNIVISEKEKKNNLQKRARSDCPANEGPKYPAAIPGKAGWHLNRKGKKKMRKLTATQRKKMKKNPLEKEGKKNQTAPPAFKISTHNRPRCVLRRRRS